MTIYHFTSIAAAVPVGVLLMTAYDLLVEYAARCKAEADAEEYEEVMHNCCCDQLGEQV